MTAVGEGAPVVVGVGGHGSADAVEWATAEAAARQSPLLLVHAFRWQPLHIDACGLIPVVAVPPSVPMTAERVLVAAVRRARAVAPEVDLSTLLLAGAPSRILLAQSRSAAVLVLGGRHRGGLHRLLTGSRAGRLSARARCPVIVVRADRERAAEPTPPRVVVGIGATPSSASALGFGFRAAAQRGIPLVAVHAWPGGAPAGREFSSRTAEADARRALGRALGRWREELGDVPIVTRLPHADPSAALIRESVGAALVVVSSHRRGAVIAGLRDSVSRTVVLRAHSAVAVVRPDGAVVNSAAVERRRRRSTVPKGDVDSTVT